MPNNPTVVFVKPGEVVLEDRAIPEPGPGQLLIQTHCTLISTGTELTVLEGKFPPGSFWADFYKYPVVPGYDNVGTVQAVGAGVDPTWVGRRVASYGKHARYVTMAAENTYWIKNDKVPDEEAVFFTLAGIAMNGVRRSHLTWGESVAVFGAGLLGQFTTRLCHLAGARLVCTVDPAQNRLHWLPTGAGFRQVNPTQEKPIDVVRELTQGRLADVAFEVTGNQDLIPDEIRILRLQGRFVLLSSPRGKTLFDFHDLCNMPSYDIIGAHNGSHPASETPGNPWTKARHAELFFELVANRVWEIAPLISHRARYTEAVKLYQMLLQDRSEAMGILLQWA